MFVSHNSLDKERFVSDFARRLRDEGLEVWYDDWSLRPGDSLTDRIFNQALVSTDVLVVVLSVNSITSNWVRQELNTATIQRIEGRCRIIPVVLDGVKVPTSLLDTVYQGITDTGSYDHEFGCIMAGILDRDGDDDGGFSASTGHPLGPDASNLLSAPYWPSVPRRFVNREEELGRLNDLLDESESSKYPCVAVLVGMAGVGKSALAAQWSNSVFDRFTDGRLYVDFAPRGRDPQPDIGDILASLLRDLGVREDALPPTLESQQATYRRLTASKRLLVVAENATMAAQVKQTLPSGDGSVVVVTTNTYLSELAIDVDVNADMLEVRSLDRPDAVAVLQQMAGPRAQKDSADDLAELSELCGGLPVALAFCGSFLRRCPGWSVRDFIDDIRSSDNPLGAVAGEHVRRPLDAVYRSFDDDQKAFYRRLGLHPGRTVGPQTAAVVAAVSQREATRMLRELFDGQLLIEAGTGRYRVHDLVAEHMGIVRADEETADTQLELGAGLIEWYHGAARRADRAIARERLRVAADEAVHSPIEFPRLETAAEAYEWYLAERHNIVAVMQLADSLGCRDRQWQMAESLWLLFLGCRAFADWRECDELGIKAAQDCGNRDAEARLRSHLARVLAEMGEHEQAAQEMSLALDLVSTSNNPALRASIRESQGTCVFLAGDNRAALEAFDRVRVEMKTLGRERSIAIADLLRSRVFNAEKRFSEALAAARSCQAAFEQLGDPVNAAKAALEAARASVYSRSDDDVVVEVQRTIDELNGLGLPYHSAQAHELAARALDGRGHDEKALKHRREAYRLYRIVGHENAERIELELTASRG